MHSIQVGSPTGDKTVLTIGPIFQTADPATPHEGIDLSIAPWDALGDDFHLYFVTLGETVLSEEATSGELASWFHVGSGVYQVTLDAARFASGRKGRRLRMLVEGTDFIADATAEVMIGQHDPARLADQDDDGLLVPSVTPTDGSIVEASFDDDALSARVIGPLALENQHLADNLLAARNHAAASLTASKLASDLDLYEARIRFDHDGASLDEYSVTLLKNGSVIPFSSIVGTPALTVTKRGDGSAVISSQALTRVGSSDYWKWDETTTTPTSKILAEKETYWASVVFSNGSTRTPDPTMIGWESTAAT